ncbi:MAG: NAD(P) transhydrogenase subunit alpha [Candidatus Sumerlaeia bacterium]|nr:NAD(P) transhydrogenase subunit alpha [Candidatus Sumerlaeia bacterium]
MNPVLLLAAAETASVSPFMTGLFAFVLACFVGYHVIWNVTPALHTPLMSVTNAISAIILVGCILVCGNEASPLSARVLAFVGLVVASINVFGGFLVTQRMLAMYKRKG